MTQKFNQCDNVKMYVKEIFIANVPTVEYTRLLLIDYIFVKADFGCSIDSK